MTVVGQLRALYVNTTPRTPPKHTLTHANARTQRGECALVHICMELTFRKKNINKTRTREHGTEPKSSKTTSDRILDESE